MKTKAAKKGWPRISKRTLANGATETTVDDGLYKTTTTTGKVITISASDANYPDIRESLAGIVERVSGWLNEKKAPGRVAEKYLRKQMEDILREAVEAAQLIDSNETTAAAQCCLELGRAWERLSISDSLKIPIQKKRNSDEATRRKRGRDRLWAFVEDEIRKHHADGKPFSAGQAFRLCTPKGWVKSDQDTFSTLFYRVRKQTLNNKA